MQQRVAFKLLGNVLKLCPGLTREGHFFFFLPLQNGTMNRLKNITFSSKPDSREVIWIFWTGYMQKKKGKHLKRSCCFPAGVEKDSLCGPLQRLV